MKLLKTKKELKTTQEVFEFSKDKKENEFIIPYKGGFGVVKAGRVKQIYMTKEDLKKNKIIK
ncbi:MAG: hypothetical protein U9R08_02855 [Nanoarchaeota archaeon]|nr:hypothetical protein [Nanoarchaeota archaeon]